MSEVHILRDELRKCIEDYILQWRHKRTGDATAAELIVMACVMSDEPLSIPEALCWMCRHSHEFPNLINNIVSGDVDQEPLPWSASPSVVSEDELEDDFDESIIDLGNRIKNLPRWHDEVREVLKNFTVPICEFDELGSKRWTSPIGSANVFLRKRLFPYRVEPRQSHFRIMDLPAEVREVIFEFALLLPRSGVWYDFQSRRRPDGEQYHTVDAWTCDRDFGLTQYLPNTWNSDKDSPRAEPKALFQVDLNTHLALFRVSKQIYKEAFPCFYSRNAFYLPNDWAFLKLFENLADAQFSHLGHIIWRWTRDEPSSEKQVQQFAALPRLRSLVVDSKAERERDDQSYATFNWDWNEGLRYSDVSHLTAIKGLQDVAFFGLIAVHEHLLRPQMVDERFKRIRMMCERSSL